MAIHLGPSVARRLVRPTRGLGSAPSPGEPGIALLFGLAPGRACRVSLPRRANPTRASSLWRWSSPRGGRELPATLRCGARTFLTPAAEAADARPSGPLADVPILPARVPQAPSGRRITVRGPPAVARSIASFASASAIVFWARRTWAAVQPAGRACSTRSTSAQRGRSLASFTRQRPWSCSTMRFESSSSSSRAAPSSRASVTARRTPVYSATLFVWIPRYSEIVASGGARGSRASARSSRKSAAPSEAGPGLPRAAPSVRTTKPDGRTGAGLEP